MDFIDQQALNLVDNIFSILYLESTLSTQMPVIEAFIYCNKNT